MRYIVQWIELHRNEVEAKDALDSVQVARTLRGENKSESKLVGELWTLKVDTEFTVLNPSNVQ